MAAKVKPDFLPMWLAQLVKETCTILKNKGTKEEVMSYGRDVKLPFQPCNSCQEETPHIKTEFLSVCAICETIKD